MTRIFSYKQLAMHASESNNNLRVPPDIDFGRAVAYETALSLRFWDEALVPDEITSALGIQPHIAHLADIALSPLESVPPPVGMWAYWAFDSRESDLEEGVLHFLDHLPQDLDIWRSLTTKYSGVLVCGLRFDKYHGGQFLSVATLKKIAQRGLALDLDLKFDGV